MIAAFLLAFPALFSIVNPLAGSFIFREFLGRSGSRTVGRLSAFILFCIGVQVFLTGVTEFVQPMLARR